MSTVPSHTGLYSNVVYKYSGCLGYYWDTATPTGLPTDLDNVSCGLPQSCNDIRLVRGEGLGAGREGGTTAVSYGVEILQQFPYVLCKRLMNNIHVAACNYDVVYQR